MEQEKDIQFTDSTAVPADERIWAAISYFPFIFILTMVFMKEKKYVFAHSKQSFVIQLTALIIGMAPVVNILLGWIILPLLTLLSIIAAIYALIGYERVPIVAKLADKLPFKG